MKNKNVLVILIFVLTATLLWWTTRQSNQGNLLSNKIETRQSNQWNRSSGPIIQNPVSSSGSGASEPIQKSDFTDRIEKRRKQMDEEREKGLNEWRTPIEFYGLVVDEKTNAVVGATVDFSCNDLSSTGTSFYHTQSDANGAFSISGIQGKVLGVKVNKEGYYAYLPYGNSFHYAGENQNFVPDSQSPIVFRLRKQGVGETLIYFHKSFKVSKDGHPLKVDLITGDQSQSDQHGITVECWTQDEGKKSGEPFDWKCRVSVPGGGLQTYDEEFPFQAPEGKYVATNEIDMTAKPDAPWKQDVKRNYFVRTSDGKYARLVFRIIAHGDHFCTIDSFLNPTGSRNLEPK